MRNNKLKYQTFNQLLDKVYDDFEMYDANSLIEPSQLIKVVKKINKELGFRITKSKDLILEFENGIVKLPLDFENINYAVICGQYSTTFWTNVQNEHREAEQVTCSSDISLFFNDCDEAFIVKKVDNRTGLSFSYPIQIQLPIYEKHLSDRDYVHGWIKGDFLKIQGIEKGNIYINYESSMEDEEGNLLVIDHPLLNDYYEYALKRRILENVYFNGEESALQKLQVIEPRYDRAKKEANGVADMPDFKELQDTLDINRKAAHKRFISIFL